MLKNKQKMEAKVIGAKVRIEVDEEGSYEGYVHHIDATTKKLSLVKVVSCATGTRLHGLHHFFPNEITNLTVLEEKKIDPVGNTVNKVQQGVDKANAESLGQVTNAESLSQVANAQRLSQVANKKPSVDQEQPQGGVLPLENEGYQLRNKRHFQKGKSIRDPSDEGSRMLQRKSLRQNWNSDDFLATLEDRENFVINPPSVIVIESLEEGFEQAIAYILRQRVIGVAWEGIKVGRFGQLCLIQIGCNRCVYIFDIETLGRRAFDCGLADIMDSVNILKVIHNCRHFSDALYHQYGVSLVNVFDTQVADAIIYRNEVPDRKLPRQTSSLISSLYRHLDLSPDQYHFNKVRMKHTKDNEMVWKNRPLHKDLVDVAAKTVMYLRELRLSQMERMMEEFVHGVDIYLSCVRDASDEVVRKKFSSTALPDMFYELQSRERPQYNELNNNENEEQHQAWGEGHDFMSEYERRGMRVREHTYPPFVAEQERHPSIVVRNELDTKQDQSTNELTKKIDKLNVFDQTPVAQIEPRNVVQNMRVFTSSRGSQWPGIFSQDDFPQLSSDSDSSGHSPHASRDMPIRTTSDVRLGRGRAASLIRNAKLPGARRPKESCYKSSSFSRNDRVQFPTDEELLTSTEIVSVSRANMLPSGPRVRISHQ